MVLRVAQRVFNQSQINWIASNESDALSNDSYWADRNETIDAKTMCAIYLHITTKLTSFLPCRCSFIFATHGDQQLFKYNLIFVQIIPAVGRFCCNLPGQNGPKNGQASTG